MRSRLIPDEYVGDTHLTNWFRRNLHMEGLQLVYINPKTFERYGVTRQAVSILGGDIILQFNKGTILVIDTNCLNIRKL